MTSFVYFLATLACTPSRATTTPPITFVPGDQYAATALPLIQNATSKIHIIQFNFSNQTGYFSGQESFSNALINAAAKPNAPTIQILLEKTAVANDAVIDQLAQATPSPAAFLVNPSLTGNDPFTIFQTVGVTVDDQTGITHTKLIFTDDQTILAGSTNWTPTSLSKNNETDLKIESPQLAAQLENYFNDIKTDSTAMHGGTFEQGRLTLLQDNSYFPELITFLNSALSGDKLSCAMYLFSVNNPEDPLGRANAIESAIVHAQTNGASVKLMLETSRTDPDNINPRNQKAVNQLIADGVTNVWWDDPDVISHMKWCVIKRASNGKYDILMGSSNWNYEDLDLNHQLNWLIKNDPGEIGPKFLAYYDAALAQPGVTQASSLTK